MSAKRDHPASAMLRAQLASDHPRDVQFLQHDDAVALGESCRLDVQEVVALPPDLAVDAGDASLGLLSVLRSFLPSADGALCVGESLERGFEVARVGDHVAVGRRAEVGDATVDGDDGAVAGRWLGHVQLADDADEPLVAVALEGARLRLPFERPVQHSAERAELREADIAAIERATSSDAARRRTSDIAALALPPGARASLAKQRCQARSSSTKSCEQTLRGTSASHGRAARSSVSSLIWSKAVG